jgi:hypothetical protein
VRVDGRRLGELEEFIYLFVCLLISDKAKNFGRVEDEKKNLKATGKQRRQKGSLKMQINITSNLKM